MDKSNEKNISGKFLSLKTGIPIYRSIVLVLFLLSFIFFIGSIIYNRDKSEIIGSLIFSFVFLMFAIFMEKIVYFLRLPANRLIVTKDEIIHKKRKNQVVFKLNEVSYKFHPFYEDFTSASLLAINSKNAQVYYITITKKQFKQIKKFLEEKNSD